MNWRHSLILLGFCLIPFLTFAQSPGNVGGGLQLWLKADVGVTAPGNNVSTWADQSGNGNNASSAATGSGDNDTAPPTLVNNAINSNPAISFDGVDDDLQGTNGLNTDEIFVVVSPTNDFTSASADEVFLGFDNVQFSGLSLGETGFGIAEVVTFDVSGAFTSGYNDATFTFSGPNIVNSRVNAAVTDQELSINGSANLNNFAFFGPFTTFSGEYILGNNPTEVEDYNGQIAEVISYNATLNAQNRRDVETYLAIKYGITLNINATTGYTLGGVNIYADDVFVNDIAGIGSDAVNQGLTQLSSQGTGPGAILSIGGATDQENGEFLIWGHNGSPSTLITGDYNGLFNNGSARIWKVEETGGDGDLGNVTITVNQSDLPSTVTDILVSNGDPTLATGTTTALVNGGATWTVTVNLSNNDYFSFVGPASTQVAPGNVPGLSLWLKADAGVTAPGNNVSDWADQSGNGNDASSAATGSGDNDTAPPTLVNNAINSNPAISFDGVDDDLQGTNGLSTNEIFVLVSPTNDFTSASADEAFLGFDNVQFSALSLGETGFGGVAEVVTFDVSGVFTSGYNDAAFTFSGPNVVNSRANAALTDQELSINGSANLNNFTAFGPFTTFTGEYILGNNPTEVEDYNGQIAEVISYGTTLGATDRRDIDTYLGVKYGITLDISSTGYTLNGGSTVLYPPDATFDNDIAGIGQDDSQDLTQTASQSINTGSVLSVGTPLALTDGDFLIWGHNGGTSTALTGNYNGATLNGSARIWKFVQTGDLGQVTITVDGTDLPSAVSHIIVDNNSDLSSPEQTILLTGGSPFTVNVDLDNNATSYIGFIGFPEIDVTGNAMNITDGDMTPSVADDTDFGNVDVASGMDANVFTINNPSLIPLNISSVMIGGNNPTNFTTPGVAANPVPAGGSTTLTITFDPDMTGLRDAVVTINSDDLNEGAFDFTIQGTGVNLPEISISGNSTEILNGDATASLTDNTDFGNSSSSVANTFTITNSGAGILTLGANAVSLSNTTDFSVTMQPANTVAASGGTSDFQITFTPSGTGVFTSTVTVANDDADESPYTFDIRASNIASPGAIGSGLRLWLKADAGVQEAASDPAEDADPVLNWLDQSGSTNNAAQATLGARPSYEENEANSNPTIRFSSAATSDFMDLGDILNFAPEVDTWTFFAVYNVAVGQDGTLLARASATPFNRQYQYGVFTEDYFNYTGGVFNASDQTNVTGNWRISSTTTTTTEPTDYFNGALYRTGGIGPDVEVENVYIGARTTAAQDFFLDGDISEIIMYNTNLTANDQRDVETYLALKYGVTLDIATRGYTLSNGATVLYDNTDPLFVTDIAGIGMDAVTQGLNQTTSQSVNTNAILQVSGATDLQDGEYLVWGTNNGDGTLIDGDYNGGINNGLNRIWRVVQTGDVGTVTLSVTLPAGVSHIIVDNNSNLASPEQIIDVTGTGPSTVNVDFDNNATSYFSFIALPEIAVTGNSVNIADGEIMFGLNDDRDFGNADIVTGSVPNVFTINNPGAIDLNITSLTITGTNASNFTTPGVGVNPVPAGGSTTFTVTFDPDATGIRNALVTINSNDLDEAVFDFTIRGIGTQFPEISVEGMSTDIPNGDTTPATADDTDFGNITTTDTHQFTINNTGSGILNLGSNAVSLSNTTDFSVSVQPATTVAATGGSTTFDITFTPSTFGRFSTIVTIANDDPDESPFTFTVEGSNIATPGDILSGLTVWMKADAGTSTTIDGVDVTSWQDQSLTEVTLTDDLYAAIAGTTSPVFRDNLAIFNSNPAIEFNETIGDVDYLAGDITNFPLQEYTFFAVVNHTGDANGVIANFVAPEPQSFQYWFRTEAADYDYFYQGNFSAVNQAFPSGVTHVMGNRYSTLTDRTEVFINNGSETDIATTAVGNNAQNTRFTLAQGPNSGDYTAFFAADFPGQIAETILFDGLLNDADFRLVNSYLAIKYGITLDITAAGYTFPVVGTIYGIDATFDNDIAGIGQDDSQGLDQVISQSVNAGTVLQVSGATSQDDGEFLVWGNNGLSATTLTADHNGGTNNGTPRVWKVEETGDLGTVTLTFPQASVEGTVNGLYVVNAVPAGGNLAAGGDTYTLTDDGLGNWTVDVDLADLDYFSLVNLTEPNLRVSGNGVNITNGDGTPSLTDHTEYGTVSTATTFSRTFTISNIGTGDLTLQNTFVSLSGSTDFSLVAQPASPVSSGGSVTFTIDFGPTAAALRTAIVSIDSDDPNEDPFTFTIQGTGAVASEIAVSGAGVDITNGDNTPSVSDVTNFGSQTVGSNTTNTYTISNSGNADLILSGGPVVSLSGATSEFTVLTQPSTPIASSGSETFTVQFNPTTAGIHQVVVSIDNNDPNENPFTFTLQGSATDVGGGSSGDFDCNCVAGSATDPNVNTVTILNDYFPGNADALSGTQTITLGARRAGGAGSTIEAGDLLLLIQMQGVEINSTLPDDIGNTNYGDGAGGNDRAGFVSTEDFTAGQYEYILVTDASGYDESTGGTIQVKNPVVNTYNHEITATNFSTDLGRQTFQVVKVANYLDLTINAGATVTGVPWNGRSGGVVVIDALSSFTLNGNINVSGLGFRGGLRTLADLTANNSVPEVGYRGEGIAGTPSQIHGYDNSPLLGGSLVGSTLVAAEAPGYPGAATTLNVTSTLGINPLSMTYAPDRGHGGPGNAGGAGRYDGSGGGGGGASAGGAGSFPGDGAITPELSNQGLGGASVDIQSGARAFLGGGGGSGGFDDDVGFTQLGASGQPGGGIVILRANNVTGTGIIAANGQSGFTHTIEGAGGGGAGGTIIVVTDTEDLGGVTVNSTGGDGGSTTTGNDAGAGGGSGGDIVVIRRGGLISNTPTVDVTGGSPGTGGAGSGVAGGGTGGFESTSLPPSANLDCPLINIPAALPGGVSGIRVWIKADADVTFDGSNLVSQWMDQSSDAFVFDLDAGGQLSTVGTTPDYIASDQTFNFNPTIEFNSGVTTDYLGFTSFANFPNSELDVFVVTNTSNLTQDHTVTSFLDGLDTENDYNLVLTSAGTIQQQNTSSGVTTAATDIRDGITRIINTRYIDGSDDTEILVDNQFLASNVGVFDVSLATGQADGTLVLAQDLDDLTTGGLTGSEAFVGKMSELVFYFSDLTTTERRRVDSYLAIKYGITLNQDQDYLNSFAETIFPGSTETVYDNNIAGIGRDDGSGLTQLQSRSINSSSRLTGSASSFSVDRSFVIWGSNGVATPAFNATGGSPIEVSSILDLEWKAYVSNSPGGVDLSIDLTGTTNQPAGTDILALLIDEDLDGDFTTGTLRVISADGYDGTNVTFSGVNFANGEPFTLGVVPLSPGGVSSGLTLWLRADTDAQNAGIAATDGQEVDSWIDQVTMATTLTDAELTDAATDGGPTFLADGGRFNFNSSLEFNNGVNDENLAISNFSFPANSFTWHSVSFANATNDGHLVSYFETSDQLNIHDFDALKHEIQDTDVTPGNDLVTDGLIHLITLDVDGTTTNVPTNTYVDGAAAIALNANVGNTTTFNTNGTLSLGQEISNETNGAFGATQDFRGQLGETVLYSGVLSATDRQKVESYLALKYGITLDQTINQDYVASNGTVTFPATSSVPDFITYANDIAGIGRDDQTVLDQRASKSINSDAVVTITNGNDAANPVAFTNNLTFLAWGNDNDDNGTIEEISSEIPSNVLARLDREWRVSVTGSLSNVTVQVDLSGVTGVGSDFSTRALTDFKLLVDADGDFTDGVVQSFDATAFNAGTEVVTISNVTLSDNDVFTFSTLGPTAIGPGGIASNLSLWLRGDRGVTLSGADVTAWADQSGNGFDATAAGGEEAQISTGTINNNNALDFDGTDAYTITTLTDNPAGSDFSIYAVTQAGTLTNSAILSQNSGSVALIGYLNTGTLATFIGGTAIASNVGVVNANVAEISGFTSTLGVPNSVQWYQDGATDLSGDPGVLVPGTGSWIIGETNAGTFPFTGLLGEVVTYTQALSDADRNRVETYLAIKYGRTLNSGNSDYTSAGGDIIYPAATDPNFSGFTNRITGIGRDDLSDLEQLSSSQSILEITKTAAFSADGQFMVWGDNGGVIGESTTSNIPSGIEVRMNRIWKLKQTNSPTGTIDLAFNLNSISDLVEEASDLRLIVDTDDGNFSNSTVLPDIPTFGIGNIYTFNGIDLSNFPDGAFFTLASTDVTNSPLPIELISFEGEEVSGGIALTWSTATEINNDFFTVEKSADAVNFEAIADIAGAGNSSERLDYNYLDSNPIQGVNYYRLVQTDFDGNTNASPIISVVYEGEDELNLILYPNPASEYLNVEITPGYNSGQISINLIDLIGHKVGEWRFTGSRARYQIPTSYLNPGVYIIEIGIGDRIYRERVLKR